MWEWYWDRKGRLGTMVAFTQVWNDSAECEEMVCEPHWGSWTSNIGSENG